MLFGNSTSKEPNILSSKQSDGFISSTQPVSLDKSIVFDSKPNIKSKQQKNILDTPSPKKLVQNGIRKISSGGKQTEKKGVQDGNIISNPVRKKTHTQKQNQGGQLLPRLINNFSITKSIFNDIALTNEQIRKIQMNYTFYIKDKQLAFQYQKLKKQTQCFKISMMKGSQFSKQISALLSSLIDFMSNHFHINQLAALDILEMYIIQNKSKYTNPKFVQELKSNGTLQLRNKDQYQINMQTRFIHETVKVLQLMLKQQMDELKNIFISASKLKFRLFKSKPQIQICCTNLWDCFNYYYISSPLNNSVIMETIIQILISLSKMYQQQFNGSFVASVIEVFDECLTKQYISNQLILKFIVRLLRLDIINLSIKGVNIDPRENIFNQCTKQVRNIIARLQSYQLLPFKVILPQIDKSLENTVGCIDIHESYRIQSFAVNKKQTIVYGSYWLDWLQLWIQQLKVQYNEQLPIALVCLYNCFETEYETFWINSHSSRFSNSIWLLEQAKRQNFVKQIFQILQKLIGNQQKSFSQEAYQLSIQIFGYDFIKSLLRQTLQNKINQHSNSCTKFICKLISLDNTIVSKIETDILRFNKNNNIVTFLMGTLEQTDDYELIQTIFEALNNLLTVQTDETLLSMSLFEQNHSIHKCLRFMQRQQKIFRSLTLLKTLCIHFNILISQQSTLSILGKQSQWLNKFKTFQPWKVKNQNTIKCIRYLLKRWSIEQNSFWSASLKDINMRNVLEPILNHFYQKFYNEDIYQNQIIRDFLKNPNDQIQIDNIKLLMQTLLLLQTTLHIIQTMKIQYYRPGMPQILELVLFTFVYDLELFKQQKSFYQIQNKIHPLLIFVNLFNVSQSTVTRIFNISQNNISKLAIDILSKILKLNFLSSKDQNKNQLNDLLRKQNQINNSSQQYHIVRFYESIAKKLRSQTIVQNIIQFLINILSLEKVLVKNLIVTLKKVFLELFYNIFTCQDLELQNKTIILLLKLQEQKKIFAEFLKQIFSSSRFWINLSCPQQINNSFSINSIQNEIRNITSERKANTRYLRQNLTRLTLISNTAKLLFVLVTQDVINDKQALLNSFFQMYNQNNIFLLFNNNPNFDSRLLQKTSKYLSFASQQSQNEINNFILDIEAYGQKPDQIIKNIIKSNTISFSNLSKLFIAVIGPSKILNSIRNIMSLNSFDKILKNVLFNLTDPLNEGKIKYPIYIYYILGLGVQMLGQKAFELIDFLVNDTRWLKYRDSEQKQGVFFLIQSIDQVKYKKQNFRKIVEFMVQNSKVDLYAVNLLKRTNNVDILQTSINQLQDTQNLESFVSACHCINMQLINLKTKSQISKVNQGKLIFTLCQSLSHLSSPIQEINFYKNEKRNPDHIIWCWSLVIVRTLNSSIKSQTSQKFHQIVINRCQTILRELQINQQGFVLTRSFKQQIQLLATYFGSLLLKKLPISDKTIILVHRLWKKFIKIISKYQPVGITDFEKTLYHKISVDRSGGMYSMRSVSPSVSYNVTSEQNYPLTLSTNKSHSSSGIKGKLSISPGELRQEISNFVIIFNLLFFIKSTYVESNVHSKSNDYWQDMQNCMDLTFQRILQFFQRSYGVMQVKELFDSLNQAYLSTKCFQDTGYLNTLDNQFSIQKLNHQAKHNIHLNNQLLLLHLHQISQSPQRQLRDQHKANFLLRIKKIQQTQAKYRALSGQASYLRSNYFEPGFQTTSNVQIMPQESRFLTSIMSKLSI